MNRRTFIQALAVVGFSPQILEKLAPTKPAGRTFTEFQFFKDDKYIGSTFYEDLIPHRVIYGDFVPVNQEDGSVDHIFVPTYAKVGGFVMNKI
jgi:hypothetical protein